MSGVKIENKAQKIVEKQWENRKNIKTKIATSH